MELRSLRSRNHTKPTFKEKCPTATHKILYFLKETDNTLQGMEVRELSTTNYGPDQWWLLLDKVPGSDKVEGARLGGWLGGWLSAAGHFKPEKIAARLRRAANFYRERAGHPSNF